MILFGLSSRLPQDIFSFRINKILKEREYSTWVIRPEFNALKSSFFSVSLQHHRAFVSLLGVSQAFLQFFSNLLAQKFWEGSQ